MHSAQRLHAASHRPLRHLSQQRIQQTQSSQVLRKVNPPSNAHCELPNSDQSIRQDTQCRPISQRMNGDLSSNTHRIHPTPLPTIHSVQAQATAPMLLHLPTLPTWDRMMHSIFMMHQSVKHSFGHREALKHCHGVTDARIGGPSSPDADPPPPPFATLPYTQHPLMSTGYDKTPNP